MPFLAQCEVVGSSEILVHDHVIVQILHRGLRCGYHAVAGERYRQAVCKAVAAVRCGVVVVDASCGSRSIGVAVLLDISVGCGVGETPAATGMPRRFPSGVGLVLASTVAVIVFIAVKTVGGRAVSRHRGGHFLAKAPVPSGVESCGVGASVRSP